MGSLLNETTAVGRKSSYTLCGFYTLRFTGRTRGDVEFNHAVDTTDSRLVLQYAVDSVTLTSTQLWVEWFSLPQDGQYVALSND